LYTYFKFNGDQPPNSQQLHFNRTRAMHTPQQLFIDVKGVEISSSSSGAARNEFIDKTFSTRGISQQTTWFLYQNQSSFRSA
jgi:hypothetical protein